MVRLEAPATCTRMAGRATLVVAEAIEVAILEAKTREDIVMVGGESVVEIQHEREAWVDEGKKSFEVRDNRLE